MALGTCHHRRVFFFFQAEDGIRDYKVTGVQTCALPICELGQLGANTFSVQKFPPIFVQGRESWEKIWRRPNITMQQALLLKDKATLAEIGRASCRERV